MYGMTISSKQANILVDFIDEEMAEYVEKKVKGVDLSEQGKAFSTYEETRTALMEVKGYATDIIKYARQHSGTMTTPNAYPLPYYREDNSELIDPWQNQST
jgi:hypothetical protein|tara:strand:- start:6722 stop:7024 length:303 start_codon:yes stop_codon:yes gene_type:complete